MLVFSHLSDSVIGIAFFLYIKVLCCILALVYRLERPQEPTECPLMPPHYSTGILAPKTSNKGVAQPDSESRQTPINIQVRFRFP